VLKNLTERQRNEVMLRVATMEGIQPTALKDLNEVLFKVLAGTTRCASRRWVASRRRPR
jgi:flagellar motor switch protein FliG